MVADYCFVKDDQDEKTCTVLVVKIVPSNLLMCTAVDEKGNDEKTITRLCKFIKESGCAKIAYRSDQARAIRALFEEAFVRSSREGQCYNGKLEQFAPEASAVGESQSNGRAENAVQMVEDKLRTYKSCT